MVLSLVRVQLNISNVTLQNVLFTACSQLKRPLSKKLNGFIKWTEYCVNSAINR